MNKIGDESSYKGFCLSGGIAFTSMWQFLMLESQFLSCLTVWIFFFKDIPTAEEKVAHFHGARK